MSNMTLQTENETQGWTRASDIMWAVGYLIASVLFVLAWANVPA